MRMSRAVTSLPGSISINGGRSSGGAAKAFVTEETDFLPAEMTAAKTVTPAASPAAVEIVLMNGRRLRGIEGVSASGLAQLIRVLESA